MNNDPNDNTGQNLKNTRNSEPGSLIFFIRTNVLFLLTVFLVILCIFIILCFLIFFKSKNEESINPVNIGNANNSEQISEIKENISYASPVKEEKNSVDSQTLGEMYAWYYFDRTVRPEFSGLLYDVDNDGAEEYIYEKNTEYFYKKYNGSKLVSSSYLPPNNLLSSFKTEELTEECRAKAAEYGYSDNDYFTVMPECALVGMTDLKSDSILLVSKPQTNSAVLKELPNGLFVNCLFFYDSEGSLTFDGAYNGTYSWAEISTVYKGSEIRGYIHADNLILDDKLK